MLNVIRILSLIGFWLSSLSLYEFLTVRAGIDGLSVCKIGERFDCATVAKSSWSIFWGIPLASWGIAFYLCILLFSLLRIKSLLAKETVSSVIFLLSLSASIFSIILFSVSYFSIGKLCPLCIAMYVVNFLMFAASLVLIKPLSLVEAAYKGSASFLRFPGLLLGIKSTERQSALARLGAVTVALILFATKASEFIIEDKFIIPQIEVNQTIAFWSKQPENKIEIRSDDFTLGRADAPIQIVEFSDFQCPACRRFYTRFEPLLTQYKDSIHFVFKNFPLDNYCNSLIEEKFHEHACYAANLARCAGEQGTFWETVDFLNHLSVFDNDEAESSLIRDEMEKGLEIIGLDKSAVLECVKSERQLNAIKKDIEQGNSLGIEGTPAIWVNGRKVPLSSNSELQGLFEKILKIGK